MANNQKLRYSVSRPVIGGAPQAVLTMDDDAARPVLLILHGGPGEAMAPFTQALSALEERFVVCLWEQRGAGLSYACGDTGRLSLSRFVSDAVEVTEYLLKRFGRKKLVLMGFSWGSLVGILAASKAPSLYSAYIGVGQIADQRLSERDAYAQTLEKARRAGDQGSVARWKSSASPLFRHKSRKAHHEGARDPYANTALTQLGLSAVGLFMKY
jgi:pimeloyl-ACP methyl ester carboxylesterase